MEGNAFVYQVYPVSRITGEGRAEFSRAWGPGFEQEGAGRGGGGTQSGRGNDDKSGGCGRNASVYHVHPVSRTTSEERAECSQGGGGGSNSFRSHRCRGLLYACC